MIPSQKAGKPSPTSGTIRTAWSAVRSRCVAAMIESGTAIRTEKIAPRQISQSVTGSRSRTRCPASTP